MIFFDCFKAEVTQLPVGLADLFYGVAGPKYKRT